MSTFKRATLSMLQNQVGRTIYSRFKDANPNNPGSYFPYTLLDIEPEDDGDMITLTVNDPDDDSNSYRNLVHNKETGDLKYIEVEQDGKESIYYYYIKKRLRRGSRSSRSSRGSSRRNSRTRQRST